MFVRAPNPIWYMVDTTGIPLNDTYYAFFLSNDLPYLPQAVYQDPNGINAWDDPVQFQPSGTLPNNLYFADGSVYRIEIRQGSTQKDPLIWLIENFVVGGSETPSGGDVILTADNLITNPQFADIFIPTTYTITEGSSGIYTVNIGPGWKLILTGSGTTTITQIANSGSEDLAGNPPYALEINNSGWTSAQLIQQFNNNGALFGGGAVALAFTAEALTSAQTISVAYNPSNVSNSQTIFTGSIAAGALNSYYGAININDSNNTDSGTVANVQLIFNLPATGAITLTNIQFLGQSTNLSNDFVLPSGTVAGSVPEFQEIPYERVVDHEFHSYRNSIIFQPKDSVLTGWNFALNPWQFTSPTAANVAANQYTADQTILVQQNYVANAAGNNVSVGQASAANNFGYQVTAVTAHNNFAIIQFIDPSTIAPYWGNLMSALVKASLITTHSSTVRFKMRLIVSTTVPSTAISQTYPIASWTEGQDPVFASGFTAITPQNDPVFTLSGLSQQFALNAFSLPAASTGTMLLGIVLYTIDNMNSAATADAIILNDVSLTPNAFAISSNPKTFDQVLRACQFYWEKSYDNSVLPGTGNAFTSYISFAQGTFFNGSNWLAYATSFAAEYNTIKRASPSLTLWNPSTGASGTIHIVFFGNGSNNDSGDPVVSGNWTLLQGGNKGFAYQPASVNTISPSTGLGSTSYVSSLALIHFTANSRIGG